jgi:pyruvate/2-oxoglutarate dehydrogenase complex dihydrolipoamide acyltransferase (E2) component
MTAFEFCLPDIGEGLEAAELLEWNVTVGDSVREDQALAELHTDKVSVVVPSPVEGTIIELRFHAGDTIPIGAVIAVIETARVPAALMRQRETVQPASTQGASAVAAKAEQRNDVLASPATRRLARERGIDLQTVVGSGPGGRIQREDIERGSTGATLPSPTPTAGASTIVPLRGVRRTIAERMTHAWQTVPHIIDYREADAGPILELRDLLRGRATRAGDEALARALTLTPLLVKIVCRALIDHPHVNAWLDMEREEITLHGACHVGIAVSTPDGLMVPVVQNAQDKSFAALAHEIVRLTKAARDRSLRSEDLRGATITVNNFGSLGIWLGTPLIAPPQVANFGIGRIDQRAVVRNGEVVPAHILTLSVSGDHRVLDGDTLAAFVTRAVELIEKPILLVDA